MAIVSLIAALDEANGLGLNNQLLCHLPADLQHFKMLTMGKPIVMGRHTYNSIGRPLPGRTNIVLSRTCSSIEGVEVVDSLSKVIERYNDAEVMIIGGAQLYEQSLNIASRLYITRIHHLFDADVFFPKINESEWACHNVQLRHADEKNKYDMTFYTYERK